MNYQDRYYQDRHDGILAIAFIAFVVLLVFLLEHFVNLLALRLQPVLEELTRSIAHY